MEEADSSRTVASVSLGSWTVAGAALPGPGPAGIGPACARDCAAAALCPGVTRYRVIRIDPPVISLTTMVSASIQCGQTAVTFASGVMSTAVPSAEGTT
jgi:hypothetical protein